MLVDKTKFKVEPHMLQNHIFIQPIAQILPRKLKCME